MNAGGTGSLGAVGEHRTRLTEPEAQLNLRTVLELCAAGGLRCSEKTHRPSAATVYTARWPRSSPTIALFVFCAIRLANGIWPSRSIRN